MESDCFNPFWQFWLEGGGGGGGAFGLEGGGGGGQAGLRIRFGDTLGSPPLGFVGVDEVEEAASHSVAVVLKVSVLVTLFFLLRVGVRLRFMLAVRSLTLESREVSERAVSEEQEEGAELPDESPCIGSEKSNMIPFSSVAMTMLDTMLVRSSTLFGATCISSSSEFASSASAFGALPLRVTRSPPFSCLPVLSSPKRASSSSFSSSSSSLGLLS